MTEEQRKIWGKLCSKFDEDCEEFASRQDLGEQYKAQLQQESLDEFNKGMHLIYCYFKGQDPEDYQDFLLINRMLAGVGVRPRIGGV